MSNNNLEKIIVEPKTPATACVVWLHGLGDSGDGFAPVVPVLNLPANHSVRFIFPHAPVQAVTINNGMEMRSWYDIKSMDLHNRADLSGVEASENLVQQLLDEQVAGGIDSKNIILAGFSQGGVMSLFTGLRYNKPLAGILALSCYLPKPDALPADCHSANKATAIMQQHGQHDEVVPFAAGKMANQVLSDNGYQITWQTYAMPHTVVAEQLNDIGGWIKQQLAL
ncbi:MAG: alpha/beta hydrolase [Thalassotalea sp.]